MNRAYLRIVALVCLIAGLWVHYFFYEIMNPDKYITGISASLLGLGIVKIYYGLKKDIK